MHDLDELADLAVRCFPVLDSRLDAVRSFTDEIFNHSPNHFASGRERVCFPVSPAAPIFSMLAGSLRLRDGPLEKLAMAHSLPHRLYFLFGDGLANASVGALAGWVGAACMEPGGSMWLGMAYGMVAGMGIAFLGGLLFIPLFGAMEVMVPTMLTGMAASMAGGMTVMLEAVETGALLAEGAAVGIGVLLYCKGVDAWFRGEDRRWM